MKQASFVEATLRILNPTYESFEHLEVKVREVLMRELGLESMDSVDFDIETYAGEQEITPLSATG